jgi:hypothetical protein
MISPSGAPDGDIIYKRFIDSTGSFPGSFNRRFGHIFSTVAA